MGVLGIPVKVYVRKETEYRIKHRYLFLEPMNGDLKFGVMCYPGADEVLNGSREVAQYQYSGLLIALNPGKYGKVDRDVLKTAELIWRNYIKKFRYTTKIPPAKTLRKFEGECTDFGFWYRRVLDFKIQELGKGYKYYVLPTNLYTAQGTNYGISHDYTLLVDVETGGWLLITSRRFLEELWLKDFASIENMTFALAYDLKVNGYVSRVKEGRKVEEVTVYVESRDDLIYRAHKINEKLIRVGI